MSESPRRQTWTAISLSLCCPGLGHLYSSRLQRGLVLFLVSLVILPVAALVAGLASSTAALVGLIISFVALLGLWLFAVIDAGRIAATTVAGADGAEYSHDYQRPLIYALFVAAGVTSPILSVSYIRQNLLEAFYIPAESMTPLLRRGDRILVNKARWRIRNLNRGDVIVFRAPDHSEHTYVKRLIGLPGELVQIDGDNVRVNGQPIELPRDELPRNESSREKTSPVAQPRDAGNEQGRTRAIPPGMCYVLGDNRNNSNDSRNFGPVALGSILGVVEYIYLPGDEWSRFGTLR